MYMHIIEEKEEGHSPKGSLVSQASDLNSKSNVSMICPYMCIRTSATERLVSPVGFEAIRNFAWRSASAHAARAASDPLHARRPSLSHRKIRSNPCWLSYTRFSLVLVFLLFSNRGSRIQDPGSWTSSLRLEEDCMRGFEQWLV